MGNFFDTAINAIRSIIEGTAYAVNFLPPPWFECCSDVFVYGTVQERSDSWQVSSYQPHECGQFTSLSFEKLIDYIEGRDVLQQILNGKCQQGEFTLPGFRCERVRLTEISCRELGQKAERTTEAVEDKAKLVTNYVNRPLGLEQLSFNIALSRSKR